MRDVLRTTGAPILQVLGLAVLSWIAEYVAGLLGAGQKAALIRILAALVCLRIVLGSIVGALTDVAHVFGY
jgi:hypothetical protein